MSTHILSRIDSTMQLVGPIARGLQQHQVAEQLSRLQSPIEKLSVAFAELRVRSHLLSGVYCEEQPAEVKRAYESVVAVTRIIGQVEGFLEHSTLLDAVQSVSDASQAITSARGIVDDSLAIFRRRVSTEIKTAQLHLKLHDLFPSEEMRQQLERATDEVRRVLERDISEAERNEDELRRRWAQHYGDLQRIILSCSLEQLQSRLQLSDSTLSLISMLLNSKLVSLKGVPMQSIEELSRLEHLHEQIHLVLR